MGRWALPSSHPLRMERSKRGWTLTELSQRSRPRVCKTDLSRYERGEKLPGDTQILGLSRALGLPLPEILSWFPEVDQSLIRFARPELEALEKVMRYMEETGDLRDSVGLLRQSIGRQLGGAA